MKVLALFAVILIVASAASIDEMVKKGREAYESNQSCYKQSAESALKLMRKDIEQYMVNPSMDLYGTIIEQASQVKTMMDSCKQTLTSAPTAGADALQLIGEALLLNSQCFQDLGGVFLIADTIVQDPTDITNDIFAAIFCIILGYQGYQDCNAWIQFVIHVIPVPPMF